MADELLKTPLYDSHVALGARMVPFAGYAMPVQFPAGIIEEHNHTRHACSVFDVSHMGQVQLIGASSIEILKALEGVTPSSLQELKKGCIKYSALLNATGGVVDDLMITNPIEDENRIDLVINASRIAEDLAFLRAHLPAHIEIVHLKDRALLAVQGPGTDNVVSSLRGDSQSQRSNPQNTHAEVGIASSQAPRNDVPQKFMTAAPVKLHIPNSQSALAEGDCPSRSAGGKGAEPPLDIHVYVARSGYTGEDGFEISVPAEHAVALYEALLKIDGVKPAGLGCRDTLRLEAGLCLYGQDLDESISPVEANIRFIIGKRRREEGSFNGAVRILQELTENPRRIRVGLLLDGRAPARSHARVFYKNQDIGEISSGSFSPSLNAPIAFAYIPPEYSEIGTQLEIDLRGRRINATVTALPFTPHHYKI